MKIFKNILHPVGLGRESEDVVPFIQIMAKQFDSQIHLLSVVRAPESLSMNVPDREMIAEAKRRLLEFKNDYFKAFPDTITSVVCGNTWEEIIYYIHSKSIDLVIMGTHGRKAFDLIVFGSVAERVIKTSPVPVLVVNPYRMLKQYLAVEERSGSAESPDPKRLYH